MSLIEKESESTLVNIARGDFKFRFFLNFYFVKLLGYCLQSALTLLFWR